MGPLCPTLEIGNCYVQLSDAIPRLLQLRVFRFGGDEDRNVWVGAFPKREEVPIRRISLRGVALNCVCASETEMGERTDWVIFYDASMGEYFLELRCSFNVFMGSEIWMIGCA
jgi:hypothetical protein